MTTPVATPAHLVQLGTDWLLVIVYSMIPRLHLCNNPHKNFRLHREKAIYVLVSNMMQVFVRVYSIGCVRTHNISLDQKEPEVFFLETLRETNFFMLPFHEILKILNF